MKCFFNGISIDRIYHTRWFIHKYGRENFILIKLIFFSSFSWFYSQQVRVLVFYNNCARCRFPFMEIQNLLDLPYRPFWQLLMRILRLPPFCPVRCLMRWGFFFLYEGRFFEDWFLLYVCVFSQLLKEYRDSEHGKLNPLVRLLRTSSTWIINAGIANACTYCVSF